VVTAASILLAVAAAGCSASRTPPTRSGATIERLDPALDALVSGDVTVEALADGFAWAEGPAWRERGGYLVFSDVPGNTIHRWDEEGGLAVFLRPSGYTGATPPGRELGTNGLAFDADGALVVADHGNRQVARLDETSYTKTVLADRFQGRRLNSPNDLTFASNGDLYFTDPPYGLRGLDADSAKELDFNGVYRLTPAGVLTLLTRDVPFPNGIALSPDERTLYVSNSEATHAVWLAWDLAPDGTLSGRRILFDATPLAEGGAPGVPDGIEVDEHGNLFTGGPGGILILSPEGRHLGTIATGQPTANCAFGDDGSSLYITSNHRLLRVRLQTRGKGFRPERYDPGEGS
jgi:gluconolactonase